MGHDHGRREGAPSWGRVYQGGPPRPLLENHDSWDGGDGIPLVAADSLVLIDSVVAAGSPAATGSLDVDDGSAAASGRPEDAAGDLPADDGAG